MQYLNKKDFKTRIKVKNKELKNLSIKFLSSLFSNTLIYNQKNIYIIKKQQKLYSKVRTTNRCSLTNRSRGIFRPFGVSRLLLRKLMLFGIIPGYSKSVW